jgi:hypothetical protein
MGKWEELISGSLHKHTRLVHTVANRVDHGAGDAGKPNDGEDLRQRKVKRQAAYTERFDQALSAVFGRVYIVSIRGSWATDAETLVVMDGVERVFVGG